MPEHDPERSSEADKALSIAPMRLIGVRFYSRRQTRWTSRFKTNGAAARRGRKSFAIGAHGTMFGDELREQFDRSLAQPLQAAPTAARRRPGRTAHEKFGTDFQTLQST
jgi:hypothetical protein